MYEPVKNYADKLFIWSDPDNAAWSSLTTVLETRQTAMGTGYPPFNSTGNPPMTLVFNDSCKCGVTQGVFWIPDSSNFADAFLWPYLDGYGNWTECQSYLGWGISAYANTTRPVQEEFLDWMMQGFTANEARNAAIDKYVLLTNEDPLDESLQPILRLWGDFNTRISGVYSGTHLDSPKSDWFGPIPN